MTSKVTIECGTCIYMDLSGELVLEKGIDIQGKLLFATNSMLMPLVVKSPFIFVQGELEISRSEKPVDGNFLLKFELIGEEDYFLEPIDTNLNACIGQHCKVGRKVIAIAGGKINVHGLPEDTPSWLHLHDAFLSGELEQDHGDELIDTIVVNHNIKKKWAPGAEILITSHTQNWSGHQVRTIQEVSEGFEQGFMNIKLDNPIPLPTTKKESNLYAAEIALLSRNIIFEGGYDPDSTRGGHLVVFHTPNVSQVLYGVEFKNFGQQGYLGRYPIHFHFCGDVTGTQVTKNTVRQSNQRCVVVHGTNNMLIEENIAFDTHGHCFLLEDGIEMGNKFIRNLGAFTKPPTKVIPNMGTNGSETDKRAPSTFWITNPSNYFVGNIAAGSFDSGFWFELKLRGDRAHEYGRNFDPRYLDLNLFRDNIAHSNRKIGLRFYPSGYRPSDIVLIEGFKAYRNMRGVFLHLSKSIRFVRCHFADNRSGMEIDRADNIDVLHSSFVGVSKSYQRLMENQKSVTNICDKKGYLVGLEHHTWKNDPSSDGSSFVNVIFSGFKKSATGCENAHAIRVDDRIQTPRFDLYTSFQMIGFEEHTDKIDFCDANAVNVTAFYNDLDGSFSPKANPLKKPSTILSNKESMLQFVDPSKCMSVQEGCYSYCEDTCFRGLRYDVNPAGTEHFMLRVCSKQNVANCVDFPGYFRGRDTTTSSRRRMFSAYLPAGKYIAKFIDEKGNHAWPSFVKEHYQMDQICPSALEVGDVELIAPPIQDEDCFELITNPKTNENPDPWLHRFGGVAIAPFMGFDGSSALTSLRHSSSNTLVQFIDNRCMKKMIHQSYEIKAWVKIENKFGLPYKCNPSVEKCPEVGVEGVWGRTVFTHLVDLSDTANGAKSDLERKGFQLLQGRFEVGDGLAKDDFVGIFIRSNLGNGLKWYIDEVKVSLLKKNGIAEPSQNPPNSDEGEPQEEELSNSSTPSENGDGTDDGSAGTTTPAGDDLGWDSLLWNLMFGNTA